MNDLIVVDGIKSNMRLIYWTHNNFEKPYVKQNRYLNKKTSYYLGIFSSMLAQYELDINSILQDFSSITIPKKLKPKIKDVTNKCLDNKLKNQMNKNLSNKLIRAIDLKAMYKKDNVYIKKIEKQILELRTELEYIDRIKVFEMAFREETVSYMEQKNILPFIVTFLKDLGQLNGIEFKEYIDNWAMKLINEYYLKGENNDKEVSRRDS
jgi:hypothetical protein